MTTQKVIRCCATLACALVLSACDCYQEEVNRVIENFESCGSSPTCDWEPSAPGDVQVTTTFHPGEHGLLLAPQSAIRQTGTVNAEEIHVVSNCAGGLILHLNDRPFRLQATTGDDQPWYRLAVVVSTSGTAVTSLGIENTNNRPCVIDEIRAIDEICID